MNILGIETSCDETSAAVVQNGTKVLSNVIASQAELHSKWGGVIPEVASRKHLELVLPVVDEALSTACCKWSDIDGIAVTNRPGLVGALLVGVTVAKTYAYVLKKPIVGVHHLDGHLHSSFLAKPDLQYPFITLIVSGGHTELVHFTGYREQQVIGRTKDDAAGECFDKCARLLGLAYPGGPLIDKLAASGDPKAISFPRSWMGDSYDFSFSGLKTAVRYFMEAGGGSNRVEDIAASLQAAIVEVLVKKSIRAALEYKVANIAIVGGVAANRGLRQQMELSAASHGIGVIVPGVELCTDNAAMIAAAGHSKFVRGQSDPLSFNSFASGPLI